MSYLSSEVRRSEEEWEPPFSVARPGMFTPPETRDVEQKSRSQEDVSLIWEVSRPFRAAAFSPTGLNNANDIKGSQRRVNERRCVIASLQGGDETEYTGSGCLAGCIESAQK